MEDEYIFVFLLSSMCAAACHSVGSRAVLRFIIHPVCLFCLTPRCGCVCPQMLFSFSFCDRRQTHNDNYTIYVLQCTPAMRPVPFCGAGALVACRNSAAVHCCKHDKDQDDSTPREGSTPCPVREVKRSACRLSDKTARPFRCGHSVDTTRGGDVHKNSGSEVDGYITIWQRNIAGLSSVKKIAFVVR
ncbi:hypothetical protein TcYC6_0094280 [Trypanosoma cruzi]|uniref:Uncharacterized protein n=1 Tax=Trypanosoma cruzi (strain CL Brener) TaxID=353153 RepID=Q4E0I4_TRYCC|nr:hypothetical protein Tc00.1047053508325.90 [Trypanosoma cruzi]EAN98280.1 hypothetical protein Tc00.1047053508325.90 [Trypanosoma cruzi]KAF8295570.1 hypothetical protein TcYC6_0094280 [Trypanosoma cruzi]RNC58192.1 hypothetical protein TcCL_ESM04240 [Trypanosoma cruzi]|eukprot:XP_820131.1 hypothetical protein [Trypanosoma cruzi strain CL Brener]